MKHIFLIDPIEKLKLHKDSSLFLALSFKQAGHEVYFLFTTDFSISSRGKNPQIVYNFETKVKSDFYMSDFKLLESKEIEFKQGDVLHFRPDPPVDATYLNLCWMSQFLKNKYKITIVNDPIGAVSFNEKLLSFKEKNSLSSLVSNNFKEFKSFADSFNNIEHFIVKPLNLFSGIGVEKYNKADLATLENRLKTSDDFLLMQPFDPLVIKGEVRSIYWDGSYLGSVLKVPKHGSFLANTSEGSSIEHYELETELATQCRVICRDLLKVGVRLVAFDILNKNISEVNITCPSLLVELSHIHQKNVAAEIVTSF